MPALLGDPDFVDVPVERLLDDKYLLARAGGVDPEEISHSPAVKPGLESTDTVHFSVLDKNDNAVAITYTLNWEFGSGVVVANSWGDLGNIQAIKIDGKKVSAAADRRGRGEARLID